VKEATEQQVEPGETRVRDHDPAIRPVGEALLRWSATSASRNLPMICSGL
jgi:hypothetical protein